MFTVDCLADRQGSVRLVVDNAGVSLGSREYTAFGAITVTSGAGLDHYAYTGREWDATLSLQYTRARMYDPATGRFISEDPLGLAAGDVNMHRYVGNAVTMYTDPSGLFWSELGELSGAFFGELWTGIKQLPGSVGRNALEIGRVGYDVIGYNVQNLTNAFETVYRGEHSFRHNPQSQLFQQLSGGGMTNQQVAEAVVNMATLGAWDLVKGTGEYLDDGDANKFRERMNSIGFNNLTGVGAFKLLKCRANRANAEPRPTATNPAAEQRLQRLVDEFNKATAPVGVQRTANAGFAARIAKGPIGELEAARIIAEVEKLHPGGVKVIWESPDTGWLAKMPDNYAYHPRGGPTEVHFKLGPGETTRGVFFEEIQHALDRHANFDWIDATKVGGNLQLHAGTFERLSKNKLFNLTPEESQAFMGLVPDLAAGKLPPVP